MGKVPNQGSGVVLSRTGRENYPSRPLPYPSFPHHTFPGQPLLLAHQAHPLRPRTVPLSFRVVRRTVSLELLLHLLDPLPPSPSAVSSGPAEGSAAQALARAPGFSRHRESICRLSHTLSLISLRQSPKGFCTWIHRAVTNEARQIPTS